MADPDRLSRVVRNLTDNAARYTPADGRVSVRVDRDGQTVVLHCYNDCDTPPAEDLSYIFERFYRGEKSRSRLHGGAGIGLAIVKELVEAHGGSVAAEWKNKVFQIVMTLPLVP
jgi:signal transduction histidine kinase